MKPFDWLLTIVSLSGLYSFFAGVFFTPKVAFELYPEKVDSILRRRFYWFLFPAALLLWRIWG